MTFLDVDYVQLRPVSLVSNTNVWQPDSGYDSAYYVPPIGKPKTQPKDIIAPKIPWKSVSPTSI